MRNILIAAAAAFSLAVIPMSAEAAPCKDAKGKFVKCPPKVITKTVVKKGPCRDAKGKFIKCK